MSESPPTRPPATDDLAGRNYWHDRWSAQRLPAAVNPHLPGLHNRYNRRMDALFHELFGTMPTAGRQLLEIGCARSPWLPYLAREFGFAVSGLDYSELGCDQARQILTREAVPGRIVCADLFAPPPELVHAFDVVVSFGVVEHFRDTAGCLRALSRFLKPNGLLFTQIPNLTGLVGRLQRCLNRATYDVHVVLTPAQLHTAHAQAGLVATRCNYFLSTGFGVVSLDGLDPTKFFTQLKRPLASLLKKSSVLVWVLEDILRPLPPTEWLSPFIICAAQPRRELQP